MFFKPTIPDDLEPANEPYALYSDWHKEAFGCRPRRQEPNDPMERAIEHATINAWVTEDFRITQLRTEVARFDFSRRMEYLMRREGLSERDAFAQTCSSVGYSCDPRADDFYGWDNVCYNWNLPYSDEQALKAKWEELNA